jgi:hypothetical protein
MREAPLPDIIQLVSQGGKSGCFHVQQDASKARIYLKDGRIVHAITNNGEGFDALMEVALWLEGSYRFEEGAQEVPATITKPNASILMELGRRMDEWRVISQKIPSVELYPQSTLLPGETPQNVNPREARLLALATGYFSVAELAEVTQKPVLTVAKDLYGLVMAGHIVLKGIRSGRAPKVDGVPAAAPSPAAASAAPVPPPFTPAPPSGGLVPISERLGLGPIVPESREEETAIVKLQAPPPMPILPVQGFPEAEDPLPVTVGGGVAADAPPVAPPKPAAAPADDPVRMAKLTAFTQRIAQAAKAVLPEAHHEMVNRLQARSTQQIIGGEGPEAVKGLALAISRGAVDAGCDAELVRTLNAQLKALFTK